MKKIILSATMMFLMAGAFSQKYKTVEDTAKLNKEYTELTADIADLTLRISAEQSKLTGYHNKAAEKTADAQNAAVKSNEQSSKAIDGDVGDARKAKRKAKQAVRDAKDARHANGNLEDQEKKVSKLNKELQKKQDRLQALDKMRAAIEAKQ